MAKGQPVYLSYLLRLWRVSGDQGSHRVEERTIWRASLESSRIGGRKIFANLSDLFAFLREQTRAQVEGEVEEWPDHLSYLLRLWRASDDRESQDAGGKLVWRASLESVCTGERRSFATLDDLFDFLREQTGVSPDS